MKRIALFLLLISIGASGCRSIEPAISRSIEQSASKEAEGLTQKQAAEASARAASSPNTMTPAFNPEKADKTAADRNSLPESAGALPPSHEEVPRYARVTNPKAFVDDINTDIALDVDDFKKKEGTEGEEEKINCEKAYIQLLKGVVCLYLHKQVDEHRQPTNAEVLQFIIEHRQQIKCQPEAEVSREAWASHAVQAVQSVYIGDADSADKGVQILVDCGCQ